ncbi:MAG: GTP-binding protein, partial [Alphaproteobacteria bacterium]
GADHDNPLEEVFSDQLLCADMVLLNKVDLLSEAVATTVAGEMGRRVRAGVQVIPTRQGRIDPGVLLGLEASAEEDVEARPSCHDGSGEHDHDDFESFAVRLGPIADPSALEDRLTETVGRHRGILRVKGFLDVPGKAMRHVIQGVGTRFQGYYDRPWDAAEARRSELVIIGLKGLDRSRITAALMAS